MDIKYNPFTGNFDLVNTRGGINVKEFEAAAAQTEFALGFTLKANHVLFVDGAPISNLDGYSGVDTQTLTFDVAPGEFAKIYIISSN